MNRLVGMAGVSLVVVALLGQNPAPMNGPVGSHGHDVVLPDLGVGEHYLKITVAADGSATSRHLSVVNVEPTPGPTPTPHPDPVPPAPTPTPDPTPAGSRMVMLIHETADKSPQWAITINQLRTGSPAKYLADKGHTLFILDDDSLAGDVKWSDLLRGLPLPVVIVSDPKTKKVIYQGSIPNTITADGLLNIIKAHGG